MAQIWINSKYGYLSAKMLISKSKSNIGYLFVPGLFEPNCDLYYFFQEFLEELKNYDKPGLVFEFSGTGDSFGSITSTTIEVMIQNLKDVIRYMRLQGIVEIIAVGRGIGANLLNSIADDENIKVVHMINPLILGSNSVQLLRDFLLKHSEKEIYLFESVLRELQTILYTSGVDMSNIEEEIISSQLLKEMIDEDNISRLCNLHGKSKLIITKDMLGYYIDNINNHLIELDFSNYNDRYSIIRNIVTN